MFKFFALRQLARRLKGEITALRIAAQDSRTPLIAKILVVVVVAYALSPIDLIPDFIPVLGYLDDLLLVPLGLALAIRLIPPEVMAQARLQAEAASKAPPSRGAAAVIIVLWLLLAAATAWLLWGWWRQ